MRKRITLRYFPSVVAPIVVLFATGCGAAAHNYAASAATGAVDAVTAPAEAQKLTALASEATGAAGKSAGDAVIEDVFGPAAQAGLANTLSVIHGQVVATVTDPSMRAEVASLREEAVGAPLRDDIDKLIDEASPRLAKAVTDAVTGALAPVDSAARADAARLKSVAIGLAVAAGALLAALAFAVFELRRHRKLLGALLHRV